MKFFWKKEDGAEAAPKKDRLKLRKLISKKMGIVLLALLAALATTYVVNAQQYNDKFIEGTIINGVDASEKTVSEMESTYAKAIESYALTLNFRGGTSETIKGSDIALTYKPGSEVDNLLKNQNVYTWISGAIGNTRTLKANVPVTYSKTKLTAIMAAWPELDPANMIAPENATMQAAADNKLEVKPEVMGTTLDAEKLIGVIENAISRDLSTLDLDTVEDLYQNPTIFSDDKELNTQMADLNDFLSSTISYEMSDGTTQTLDASRMKDWMSPADAAHPYEYIDTNNLQKQVTDWITELAKLDDNYGNFRNFTSTQYGTVHIPTDALHGHSLDQAAMVQETYNALASHTSLAKKVTYTQFVDQPDPTFGGTYVEVDISSQEVFVYKDHQCVFSTDCVTGNETTSPTPSGVWEIYYREKNAELTGQMTSDGTPSYISHVKYWMAFHEGYGLHDAWWRYGEFGGTIFYGDGSHGCVNLPEDSAAQIWDLTDYGTPVIVFRG